MDIQEAFEAENAAASEMGLLLMKIKYIEVIHRSNGNIPLTTRNCIFENVFHFKYLGITVTTKHDRNNEIKKHITDTKCMLHLKNHF